MATLEETLRSLGLSAARGIPQLATGFVDLAALPFTATGMLKPEQAVGSTAYLTSKGLLPPEQQGLLNQTTELVSSAMNPAIAAKAALAKGGLLMAAPIAYHGTPYLFDKFDISKVGAGEGAQAYGHGMYFAERPGIASEYQKNLSSGYANKVSRGEIKNPEYRKAQADLLRFERDLLKKYKFEGISPVVEVMYHGETKFPKEVVEKIKQLSGREEEIYNKLVKGNLYKVDIPNKSANTFLDWDKPIGEQSKNVQNTLKKISDKYGLDYDNTYTGNDFYRALTVDLNAMGMAKNYRDPQAAASEMLNSSGIGGIRYFDAASRGGKQNTSNYVVFDPSIVKILERNNQPMQGLLK
jgi:hypothetical protein